MHFTLCNPPKIHPSQFAFTPFRTMGSASTAWGYYKAWTSHPEALATLGHCPHPMSAAIVSGTATPTSIAS